MDEMVRGRQLERYSHAPLLNFAGHQLQRLAEDIVRIDGLKVQAQFAAGDPREIEQVVDEFYLQRDALSDDLDIGAGLRRQSGIIGQGGDQEQGGVERGAQFMRERREKLILRSRRRFRAQPGLLRADPCGFRTLLAFAQCDVEPFRGVARLHRFLHDIECGAPRLAEFRDGLRELEAGLAGAFLTFAECFPLLRHLEENVRLVLKDVRLDRLEKEVNGTGFVPFESTLRVRSACCKKHNGNGAGAVRPAH